MFHNFILGLFLAAAYVLGCITGAAIAEDRQAPKLRYEMFERMYE